MAARQGKPGLSGVIEVCRIERPDVGIDAAVFHVAVGAGSADGPVHATLRSNPVRHGLVARQAAIRRDLPVRPMAALTLACPVKSRVSLREGTGRRHLTGLCEGRGCR
jgi:hypothetical protein